MVGLDWTGLDWLELDWTGFGLMRGARCKMQDCGQCGKRSGWDEGSPLDNEELE